MAHAWFSSLLVAPLVYGCASCFGVSSLITYILHRRRRRSSLHCDVRSVCFFELCSSQTLHTADTRRLLHWAHAAVKSAWILRRGNITMSVSRDRKDSRSLLAWIHGRHQVSQLFNIRSQAWQFSEICFNVISNVNAKLVTNVKLYSQLLTLHFW